MTRSQAFKHLPNGRAMQQAGQPLHTMEKVGSDGRRPFSSCELQLWTLTLRQAPGCYQKLPGQEFEVQTCMSPDVTKPAEQKDSWLEKHFHTALPDPKVRPAARAVLCGPGRVT